MELAEYVVIAADDPAKLSRQVNMTIRQGYECRGIMTATWDGKRTIYAQPMMLRPHRGAVDIEKAEER